MNIKIYKEKIKRDRDFFNDTEMTLKREYYQKLKQNKNWLLISTILFMISTLLQVISFIMKHI